jgi:hypothetical protein
LTGQPATMRYASPEAGSLKSVTRVNLLHTFKTTIRTDSGVSQTNKKLFRESIFYLSNVDTFKVITYVGTGVF